MAVLDKYYLGSTNKAGINALVALYFIFGAFFTSTVECTSYVYGSEIWPTYLRSQGSTLAYASFFGNAIAYSAPVSVALKNIGWKFYMVFVAVTLISTVIIFFYFPEVSLPPSKIFVANTLIDRWPFARRNKHCFRGQG